MQLPIVIMLEIESIKHVMSVDRQKTDLCCEILWSSCALFRFEVASHTELALGGSLGQC